MPVAAVRQDPANLKPGDFNKPPGEPRQYYWMNDYENECRYSQGNDDAVSIRETTE